MLDERHVHVGAGFDLEDDEVALEHLEHVVVVRVVTAGVQDRSVTWR